MSNSIAILGDTHLGARGDSTAFHNFFEKFYTQFIADLDARGIKTILQLGDLWDRRKFVNFNTLLQSRKYFFDQLAQRDIKLITLLGNHDVYFRDTLNVNSSTLLLNEYSNITVIDKPATLHLGNTDIAVIPWICSENYAECMQLIKNTPAEYCAGHFEIVGFEMYRGQTCHEGLTADTFSRFSRVWSGHYHHRSTRGNVTYVGTPYEITWQDYADQKGYHIFDTATGTIEFCPTRVNMFERIEYDDTKPVDLDTLELSGKHVKLVVVNKTDYYEFDKFVNKLYTKNCLDIKIIEDMSEFEKGEVDDTIDLTDTLSILSNYIDSVQTDTDKEKIKNYMKALYVEALNVEVV